MTSFSTNDTSPWISISLKCWEPLIAGRTTVKYKKDTFLFCHDEPCNFLFIICNGRVRITSYHESGLEKQFYIAEHGSLCNIELFSENHLQTANALAIVETEVYKIPRDEVIKITSENKEIAFHIMEMLIRLNSVYTNQIISLSFCQAMQRVAAVLKALADQYGTITPDGILIENRFTHQDISSLINVSRVTVNVVINKLRANNVLAKYNKYIIVKDMSMLEALATGKLPTDKI